MKVIHHVGRIYDVFLDAPNPAPTGFEQAQHLRIEVDHNYRTNGIIRQVGSTIRVTGSLLKKLQAGLVLGQHYQTI